MKAVCDRGACLARTEMFAIFRDKLRLTIGYWGLPELLGRQLAGATFGAARGWRSVDL
jgi:hypothetical protein